MKRALASIVATGSVAVGIAGCPPAGSTTGGVAGPQPVEAEAGCPAGSDVYLASYLSSEPGKGHTGWVLPLRDDKVASVTGMPEFAEAGSDVPEMTVPQKPVWILQPGTAPCHATIGKPYRAAIDVAASPNVAAGVELDGCPAPAEESDDEAIVIASTAAPGQCQIVSPHPVAARLGDVDAHKAWSRPTKQTPIPAPIAALVPPHACDAPGCEQLWSFMQVDVGLQPVAWSGAVNWMKIAGDVPAPPETVCKWPAETYSGFFVAAGSGSAQKVEDGQDHPLVLTAVLADHAGARVLIADGAGEYATYDLAADGAKLARHVVWLLADPAAYTVDDRVGPVCDPQQGSGALVPDVAPAAPARPPVGGRPTLAPLPQPGRVH